MITDEQLVELAKTGDKQAWEQLYSRFKPRVLALARRFFLCGGETEDLVQEGMFGLYSAVQTYNGNLSAFSSYAYSCIRNRIIDSIKKSRGAKYAALNNFLPIVEVCEPLSYDTPEDELIRRENKREFLSKIGKYLSSFEFKVFVMYMDGFTMTEISAAMGKSVKSIDNALTRSKHKLQKAITEE